ncbi:MAG: hypothetical protein MZV63_65490 [Marinilabiliales bacterium]|nr:hypothetical protein [Marinilabiliales bacterium]
MFAALRRACSGGAGGNSGEVGTIRHGGRSCTRSVKTELKDKFRRRHQARRSPIGDPAVRRRRHGQVRDSLPNDAHRAWAAATWSASATTRSPATARLGLIHTFAFDAGPRRGRPADLGPGGRPDVRLHHARHPQRRLVRAGVPGPAGHEVHRPPQAEAAHPRRRLAGRDLPPAQGGPVQPRCRRPPRTSPTSSTRPRPRTHHRSRRPVPPDASTSRRTSRSTSTARRSRAATTAAS